MGKIIGIDLGTTTSEIAFMENDQPKIITDCFGNRIVPSVVGKKEDGTVDFSKDFFNKPTNLTVSGQLNGETYAMAFKRLLLS